jgi:hypothetical protein
LGIIFPDEDEPLRGVRFQSVQADFATLATYRQRRGYANAERIRQDGFKRSHFEEINNLRLSINLPNDRLNKSIVRGSCSSDPLETFNFLRNYEILPS